MVVVVVVVEGCAGGGHLDADQLTREAVRACAEGRPAGLRALVVKGQQVGGRWREEHSIFCVYVQLNLNVRLKNFQFC